MKIQLKYNAQYLIIDVEDNFTEPLFICINKDGHCWIQSVVEETDLPYFQKMGIIYKKAVTSQKVAEFILRNNPKNFSECGFIEVFKIQQNISMYHTSSISKGITKCDFKHFIYKVLLPGDSGEIIMEKLQNQNLEIYNQLVGRGKADLTKFKEKPPIECYAKFHEFIKKNW